MSIFFLCQVFLFVIVFYILAEEEQSHKDIKKQDEEEAIFVTEISGEEGNYYDFKKSVKICFRK